MGCTAEDPMAGGKENEIEIKIKTLDSQTYTMRVNKQVPVPDLKQQIATVTGVLSDQQRLICRGKVLKDDQRLCAYRILFVNFSFSFFFFLLFLCSHSLPGNYYQLPLYGFQMIVVVLIILKQMNFIHLLYLNLLVIAIFRL